MSDCNVFVQVIKKLPDGSVEVVEERPLCGEEGVNIPEPVELAGLIGERGAVIVSGGEKVVEERPGLVDLLLKRPVKSLKHYLFGVRGDVDNTVLKLLSKTRVISVQPGGVVINAGILGNKQWREFVEAFRDRYGKDYAPGDVLWVVLQDVLNRNCTPIANTGEGKHGKVLMYRCVSPEGKEFYTVLELLKPGQKQAYNSMTVKNYDNYSAARVEYMRAGSVIAPDKIKRVSTPPASTPRSQIPTFRIKIEPGKGVILG